MNGCERSISATVATPGSRVSVKRVAVGLHDHCPLDEQVDSSDAREMDLGSNAQTGVAGDEACDGLEPGLGSRVGLGDQVARAAGTPADRPARSLSLISRWWRRLSSAATACGLGRHRRDWIAASIRATRPFRGRSGQAIQVADGIPRVNSSTVRREMNVEGRRHHPHASASKFGSARQATACLHCCADVVVEVGSAVHSLSEADQAPRSDGDGQLTIRDSATYKVVASERSCTLHQHMVG